MLHASHRPFINISPKSHAILHCFRRNFVTGNLKWVENMVSFVDVCCASNPFPEQNTKQAVHSRMMNHIVKLHAEQSLFSRVVPDTDFARYQAKGPDICMYRAES